MQDLTIVLVQTHLEWENIDANQLQFKFPENWSDNFYVLKPVFNAVTDL